MKQPQSHTKFLTRRTLLALPCLAPLAAWAGYPERSVQLVVPFGPGSATDSLMRIVAEPLGAALGQAVVIENKPGALTSLALERIKHAAPDGYTIVSATTSIVANPAGIQRNITYDPFRDFTPITKLAVTSYVLVVPASKPWKTFRELADYARSSPGKLNYGSGNLGGQIYGGMLAKAMGTTMMHVPYKSTPPALIDLIGGRVELMVTDIVTAAAQVKAGKIRALLATAPQRTDLFPDVPTIAEIGLQDVADMPAWWALYGPAGMPKDVVERLNREVTTVLKRPNIRARLATLGVEAAPSSPQELIAFMREQSQNYVRLIKEFNIQPE